MTNTNLLPCPFCGGKADSRCTAGPDPDWFVECTECFASAPVFNEDKLDGWNRRAQKTDTPDKRDERAAFEAQISFSPLRARTKNGNYSYKSVESEWKGWQARAALDT